MSETPDPVSLRSLSLSGSDASRASDLFLRIDFDRLCVSFDTSMNDFYYHTIVDYEYFYFTFRLNPKQVLIDELLCRGGDDFTWHKGSSSILFIAVGC